MTKATSFVMTTATEAALAARPGALGTKINHWLTAMAHILRYEKARMSTSFNMAERAVIIDASRQMSKTNFAGSLQATIKDLKLAKLAFLDEDILNQKLDALTPAAQYALRDALEMFEVRLKDDNNIMTQEHLFD